MNSLISIRILITSTLLLGCCFAISADSFDDYVKRKNKEWNNYVGKMNATFEGKRNEYNTKFEQKRTEYNAKFVEYLAKPWNKYELKRHKQKPSNPSPDRILPSEDTTIVKSVCNKNDLDIIELPYDDEIDLTIKKISDKASHIVNYYGSMLKVEMTKAEASKFKIVDTSEKSASDAMQYLTTNAGFMKLVDNCIALKDAYKMCDWGYVLFTDKLAKSYFGEINRNERIILRAFILTQSGYDIRIGQSKIGFELLIYSKDDLFVMPYIKFENNPRRYYMITNSENSVSTYKYQYCEDSKSCNMVIISPQVFASRNLPMRYHKSRLGLNVATTVNKNLMDFYDDYPLCRWDVYAISGMSTELFQQVIISLKSQVSGLKEVDAVSLILNFVQTAFPYKKDAIQFKTERPLFPDESFYYNGCDCEDHAILFAYLINKLVGLDVLFLQYDEPFAHLSTAIKFNSKVVGDGISCDGEWYVMCDPTIGGAGAGIGIQAKECKYLTPKCYKINFK